jgi:hypothetical protein
VPSAALTAQLIAASPRPRAPGPWRHLAGRPALLPAGAFAALLLGFWLGLSGMPLDSDASATAELARDVFALNDTLLPEDLTQ